MSESVPLNEMIKVISAEGHEFFITRRVAYVSGTMKAMLAGQFQESKEQEIKFPEISTAILEKTIQYCHYKLRYSNSTVSSKRERRATSERGGQQAGAGWGCCL